MAAELYIYWKVSAAQMQPALHAAQALQAALRQRHAGLQARLLQRCDSSESSGEFDSADSTGSTTLMEIYSHPGGIGPGLLRDIEAEAALHLAPLAPPAVQRHVEHFEPR